jgi:hypothetical protein
MKWRRRVRQANEWGVGGAQTPGFTLLLDAALPFSYAPPWLVQGL